MWLLCCPWGACPRACFPMRRWLSTSRRSSGSMAISASRCDACVTTRGPPCCEQNGRTPMDLQGRDTIHPVCWPSTTDYDRPGATSTKTIDRPTVRSRTKRSYAGRGDKDEGRSKGECLILPLNQSAPNNNKKKSTQKSTQISSIK